MWLIPLLDTRHYCGVEPNRGMVERGLRDYLDPAVVALREPRFSFNDEFDLSEFDTEFTHMLLRSVWTHATKPQIEQCLDAFAKWATPDESCSPAAGASVSPSSPYRFVSTTRAANGWDAATNLMYPDGWPTP